MNRWPSARMQPSSTAASPVVGRDSLSSTHPAIQQTAAPPFTVSLTGSPSESTKILSESELTP